MAQLAVCALEDCGEPGRTALTQLLNIPALRHVSTQFAASLLTTIAWER